MLMYIACMAWRDNEVAYILQAVANIFPSVLGQRVDRVWLMRYPELVMLAFERYCVINVVREMEMQWAIHSWRFSVGDLSP